MNFFTPERTFGRGRTAGVVRILSSLGFLCAGVLGCTRPPAGVDPALSRWRSIKSEIRRDFPGVRHLDTEAAQAWVARSDVRLLDVRARGEFAVSHLPGAISSPDPLAGVDAWPKHQPILVYCSVGYRSARAAATLAAAGYTNVHNYLGSIFEWANQGLPLERDGRPATQVHPYNSDWGRLLRSESRAPLSGR